LILKYFLDIEQNSEIPNNFVIKSDEKTKDLLAKIKANATKTYVVAAIVDKYMNCIEEVINIPTLNERFKEAIKMGYLNKILDEVITQSKVEFNYTDTDEIDDEE
jgi:PKD repeat protein